MKLLVGVDVLEGDGAYDMLVLRPSSRLTKKQRVTRKVTVLEVVDEAALQRLEKTCRRRAVDLSKIQDVQKVDLSGVNLHRDVFTLTQALRRCGNLPALETLDLSNCGLSQDSVASLMKVLAVSARNLQNLTLGANSNGDGGAQCVADALQRPGAPRALRRLDLHWCRISEVDVAVLMDAVAAVCPQVEVLDLANNGCGDGGARRIEQALQQPGALLALRVVDLLFCGISEPGGSQGSGSSEGHRAPHAFATAIVASCNEQASVQRNIHCSCQPTGVASLA